MNSPEISAYFQKFALRDGAVVLLDSNFASNHIRQCINDLKRGRSAHHSAFFTPTVKQESTEDEEEARSFA